METKTRIPVGRPDLGPRERQYVRECMASGWISQGRFADKAAELLKAMTGRKYVFCTSSGTTALIASLLALKPKWYPWTCAAPALTFAAVHNSIRIAGANIWPMGADLQSWQVPVNEWKQVRWDLAVCAPCYGKVEGVDVAVISGVSDRFKVIEDAAESFGGSLNGRPAGSFGHISCISFYANKIVTSGEGGAVLTDDPDLVAALKLILNHGIGGKNYASERTGMNGRMTDLQAAVLCAQLERMPEMIAKRNAIMERYRLASVNSWHLPSVAPGEILAPWLFAGIPEDRDGMIRRCDDANIEWRPFFPISFSGEVGMARKLSASGLCLPLSSALMEEEVERVCEVISGR